MKLLSALTILMICIIKQGLAFEPSPKQDTVYLSTDVDQIPNPEKGLNELNRQFHKNFRYPADARVNGIQGTVSLFITIDKAGNVIECVIDKGLCESCDQAALDAFKKVNLKWIPGVKDGKNVDVKISIPFKLILG